MLKAGKNIVLSIARVSATVCCAIIEADENIITSVGQ